MAKKVLCIEVGLRFTRIVELTGYKATPIVHNCITFATPQGSYEDGYIREKNTLGSVIKQQLLENKIRTTEAIFIINSTKIANREVDDLPNVSKNKIAKMVEMQAANYFPIDISDYSITYYLLNKPSKKKGENARMRVLLLAAPNNLVNSYYNLASVAGLQIEALDYAGNSYYQVIKRQTNQGVNIAIHINENTSLVNILENDSLLLQRVIPYGANDIIEKVRENSVFNMETDEDAITLLSRDKIINFQFEPVNEDDDLTFKVASDSYDMVLKERKAKNEVTESLKFLVNNVVRVLDYFSAKQSDKKIGYIYLSGIGSKFQGLKQLLKNELGYDTKIIDTLYVNKFSSKANVPKSEFADYIACVGSGISPVNFGVKRAAMPSMKKADTKKVMKVMVGAITVCIICNVGAAAYMFSVNSTKKRLNNDISKLQGVQEIYDKNAAINGKLRHLQEMYSMTETKSEKLDMILDDLEEKIPSGSNITEINVTNDKLTMQMEVTQMLGVSKLIESLKEIPYFSLFSIKSVASTDTEQNGGLSTYKFSIDIYYSNNDQGALVKDNADGNSIEAESTENVKEGEELDNTDKDDVSAE